MKTLKSILWLALVPCLLFGAERFSTAQTQPVAKAAATTWTLLQPDWVAYMVEGKWLRNQASAPPNATRIQKNYNLRPGTQYRIVHRFVVNGKPMNLPNGQPALIYSPPLDATAFGTPISNPGIPAGEETVNVQPNFPLDDPAREYWFEVAS